MGTQWGDSCLHSDQRVIAMDRVPDRSGLTASSVKLVTDDHNAQDEPPEQHGQSAGPDIADPAERELELGAVRPPPRGVGGPVLLYEVKPRECR